MGAGRALVVTNRLPYPLDDGWKRRTFHIVRAIGRKLPVTLFSLHDGDEGVASRLEKALGIEVTIRTVRQPRLRKLTAAVLGAVTPLPYHVWRQRSATLRRLIRVEANRKPFDIAVATLAHLDPYIRAVDAIRVIDTHNIDSLVLRRYARSLGGIRSRYAWLTADRLESHEKRVFTSADLVLVCSEEERDRVRAMVPSASVETVPNGVDSQDEFRPPEVNVRPGLLIFFGRLDYYPNADAVRWFAERVLPLIREVEPDAELTVVGPGASRELQSLSDRIPNLRFAGRVDDLRKTVGQADVVVVPLRVGGGTRLKILEALSLERAVVSTRIGAEGLELEHDRELIFADEPAGFAEAVIRLLRNPSEARRLGANGRATVTRRYDWSIIENNVSHLLEQAMSTRPVRGTRVLHL